MRHSKYYRQDDSQELNPAVKKYLNENYLRKLKNLNRNNPKLLVVFSGGQAVGKTTLSRQIESKLKAIVIENDEIRRLLTDFMPNAQRRDINSAMWKYTMNLYRQIDTVTTNGLVVRDGVIDWYFDRILPIFKAKNYQLFIIGYDVSPAKATELIKKRGDKQTVKKEMFLSLLNEKEQYIKLFRKHYTPDVILDDNNLFDHDMVIQKLRQKLDSLTPTA